MVKFFRTLIVSALAVLAFGGAGMALGTALAGEAEAATARPHSSRAIGCPGA